MDNNNFNQTEPQQPQYYEPPVAQPTWNNDAPSGEEGKTQAIWSLVTGILSVVCCQICCIPAIILAVVNQVINSGKIITVTINRMC